ncbi:hypothetical protein EDB84DRAFT_1452207, partial [Lactarius hengduanensis]
MEPVIAPPSPLAPPPTSDENESLTPIRAHYLKKSLIQLQFSREIQAITSNPDRPNISTLSYLGPPFSPPPKGSPVVDLPFLRYLFRQYVLTFPFLVSAPKNFFPDKVQPFVSSLLSRELYSTSTLDDEPADSAGTAKLVAKAERSFALFLNYAIKTIEKEETVRLSQRRNKLMKNKDVFEVNVVCVRTVVDRGRVRSKVHEEFIIRTQRSHCKDVYVSRRYGDFRTLYNELRKAHPDEDIRPPPAKDRTYGSSRAPLSPTSLPSYADIVNHYCVAPVIMSFLLSDPTTLSDGEREDARLRREISARVDSLRGLVKSVKGDLLGKDGLTRMFEVIRTTDNVRNLPPEFQAVIEWGRISLRIHGFMPYFMLKAALKISNPVTMIRSILDLFLAQPFGGRSLLQRMFTSSLNEEVKSLEEDIEAVKDKVDDPVICEKVRQFVYAPREIQAIYKSDAAEENIHVLAAVLRSGEEPALSRAQVQRVVRSHREHREYLKYRESLADSDDDDGPQNEDAWLFEDLAVLTKLYSRLRDKKQLIALIFEVGWDGHHRGPYERIITIFYSPLAQVYRAASIAESIGDLQNFINDLIRTVETSEELSQEDPQQTVQIFIDLIQRHEQSFYYFVHKVQSKGEGLFSGLMRWTERFLDVVRNGLGEPISLEFILPHTGEEHRAIMKEIDEVALYHYRLKVQYESRVRRRFGRAGDATTGEDPATQEVVNGFMHDASFGDLMREDAQDMAAEEEESDGSDESSYDGRSPSPIARLRVSPSAPSMQDPSHHPAQQPFPSSPPIRTDTPAPNRVAAAPSRTPSMASPGPSGSRLRKLSQSLRKSRSMTFGTGRPTLSNSAEAPPPPLPPLPPSVAQSRSAAPLTGRSKPLPPQPSSPSSSSRASSSRRAPPPLPHEAPAQKTTPTRPKKKQAASEGLKPPELKKIAELLPIFVEMMRPSLFPQTGS